MHMTPVRAPDYGKMLNEAYAARHTLLMGQSAVVYADGNGERVEYRPADGARLEAYIARLEQLCGVARLPSGPMGVFL
jgi:hypothetical protein